MRALFISAPLLALPLMMCSPLSAEARCREAPQELKSLSRELDQSASPKQWRALWERLSSIDAQLKVTPLKGAQGRAAQTEQAEQPEQGEQAEQAEQAEQKELAALSLSPSAQVCLRELMFEVSFYLSDERLEGPLWSARAFGAALTLSALEQVHQLTPSQAALSTRALRLQDLQRRLTARNASQQSPQGAEDPQEREVWLASKGLARLEVPRLARPVTLSFSPPTPLAWRRSCGLSRGCEEVPEWSVELPSQTPVSLTLPQGEYKVRWSGPCADERESLSLSQAEAPLTLTPPQLACRSTVTLNDPHSGEAWVVGSLLEGEERTFEREGYEPISLKGLKEGGVLSAQLKRCRYDLTWSVSPASASVSAPKSVAWGVMAKVRAEHPGYEPIERAVTLPQVKRCADLSPHHLKLTLPRRVKLIARDSAQRPVPLTSVSVGGLPESSTGELRRPPSTYHALLNAKGFEPLHHTLKVTPCEVSEQEAAALNTGVKQGSWRPAQAPRCQDLTLSLSLKTTPPPPLSTSKQLQRLGWVSGGAGLALLALKAIGQRSYEGRPYVSTLGAQREVLDQQLALSYALLGLSAGLYGVGLLWPALSSEP